MGGRRPVACCVTVAVVVVMVTIRVVLFFVPEFRRFSLLASSVSTAFGFSIVIVCRAGERI